MECITLSHEEKKPKKRPGRIDRLTTTYDEESSPGMMDDGYTPCGDSLCRREWELERGVVT